MIFAYREYEVQPTPERPEHTIHRPVIPIRVSGPGGSQVVMALVDTGSDVTVLPAFVLNQIGLDSQSDERGIFRGVGGQLVTARYSTVTLTLDGPDGPYRWSIKAGFLDGREVAILGTAGFLEFFQATFDHQRRRLTLKPNTRFHEHAGVEPLGGA